MRGLSLLWEATWHILLFLILVEDLDSFLVVLLPHLLIAPAVRVNVDVDDRAASLSSECVLIHVVAVQVPHVNLERMAGS